MGKYPQPGAYVNLIYHAGIVFIAGFKLLSGILRIEGGIYIAFRGSVSEKAEVD